jgi:hypothetical protein
MSLSGESHQKWNFWDQLVQETAQVNLRFTPYDLRRLIYALLYATCLPAKALA